MTKHRRNRAVLAPSRPPEPVRGSREGRGVILPENGCEERTAQVVEDVQWLHETGESPIRWPKRVGSPSHGALNQTLRRAGRQDLAKRLDPYC